MKQVEDFLGMDFTNWLVFKMLIQIYGEDMLISMLTEIKKNGGVDEIHLTM